MEDKGRIVSTSKETEGTKELERKPSLKHSVSKDDEKMKVNEFIADRSTIAVEELKQDVIKANDSKIKSVESEETKKINPTINNECQKDSTEKDLNTKADKSTEGNNTYQDLETDPTLHSNKDQSTRLTKVEVKVKDVSTIDKKDNKPEDKPTQKPEAELKSINNNENLKIESKTEDKNSALEQTPKIEQTETHKIAQIADDINSCKSEKDNIDPKDELNKECKTKLNQPTDEDMPSKEMDKKKSKPDEETSENTKTLIVPKKFEEDSNVDLKIDTKPIGEKKEVMEGDSVLSKKAQQVESISKQVDSKMESPDLEAPKIDVQKNNKNLKENSSQEKKVKMIKKKKKKSPIVEESSEINFDEVLSPKEIEKKSSEKTENSYIVEEPDTEEKVKLNVHPERELVEISEEKTDTREEVNLIVHPVRELIEVSEEKNEERSPKPWPATEKTSEDLSPIPPKEPKSSENTKIDVSLKQTPKIEEPVLSSFELEEVELKPKSTQVKKEVKEVYIRSMGIILMKLTKHA